MSTPLADPRKHAPVVVGRLPKHLARDAPDAVQASTAAVGRGELTAQEGASVAGLIETCRRTLELPRSRSGWRSSSVPRRGCEAAAGAAGAAS